MIKDIDNIKVRYALFKWGLLNKVIKTVEKNNDRSGNYLR